MNFDLTEDQQVIADLAEQILAGQMSVDRLKVAERGAGWDPDVWAALAAANLVSLCLPEHLGGSGAVHVGALLEGTHQARVLGQVGHDPQLDLRIVGRQQLEALRGDERAADAAAILGADRDVLQVRV